jgi:[ribosomal protein S18]-alanine N-acetyltransferase
LSAVAEEVTTHDACEADLDAITALESRAFPIPWKRDYFGVEIGAPHRFNRVAREASGMLVGYVFCAHAGGEIHVNKIAVAERWRRRGIARMLMEEVIDLGFRIAAYEIYLEVRTSNAPAQTFYRSFGFHEAGRRPAYYFDGEDALVMVRALDPRGAGRQTRNASATEKGR